MVRYHLMYVQLALSLVVDAVILVGCVMAGKQAQTWGGGARLFIADKTNGMASKTPQSGKVDYYTRIN